MHRICCYTLFDITRTGVLNRSKPIDDAIDDWLYRRNTQCNFDTILQVISLRSQPEVVKLPERYQLTSEDLDKFGFLYSSVEDTYHCWKFEFEIQHPSVFENGIKPLGALYKDCEGVPMINTNGQHPMCPKFLDVSAELQNVYFEAV